MTAAEILKAMSEDGKSCEDVLTFLDAGTGSVYEVKKDPDTRWKKSPWYVKRTKRPTKTVKVKVTV